MDEKTGSHEHHEHASPRDHVLAESKMKVQNPKLATILETHKPKAWGKGYRRLYVVCMLMFFCSTMNVRHSYSLCHAIDSYQLQRDMMDLSWVQSTRFRIIPPFIIYLLKVIPVRDLFLPSFR